MLWNVRPRLRDLLRSGSIRYYGLDYHGDELPVEGKHEPRPTPGRDRRQQEEPNVKERTSCVGTVKSGSTTERP